MGKRFDQDSGNPQTSGNMEPNNNEEDKNSFKPLDTPPEPPGEDREGLNQMNEFASPVSGNVEILLSIPVLGNNSSPSYADVTKKKRP